MQELVIDIPAPMWQTSNQRLHHMERARRTKHVRTLAGYLGKQLEPTTGTVHVMAHISAPKKSRADVGNTYPTVKACIDGLTDAGVWADDNDDHLIDKAAAAIYQATVFGDEFAIDAWHDMADDNPIKITARMYARAALEAVAADIWDEGWSQGMAYVVGMERGTDDEDLDHAITNPYRASETA